jgi:hypothetical protein
VHGAGSRYEGDEVWRGAYRGWPRLGGIEQIFDTKRESSQDPVHGWEAETTLAPEKVGDVRLLEARLPGKGRGCEQLAIDPADEFQSQPLMQLREIHAVEVAKELYTPGHAYCLKTRAAWGFFRKPEMGIFRLIQSNFWFQQGIDRF